MPMSIDGIRSWHALLYAMPGCAMADKVRISGVEELVRMLGFLLGEYDGLASERAESIRLCKDAVGLAEGMIKCMEETRAKLDEDGPNPSRTIGVTYEWMEAAREALHAVMRGEPLKHGNSGEWLLHADIPFGEADKECSVCHAMSLVSSNYCHACGAVMRGEDRTNEQI